MASCNVFTFLEGRDTKVIATDAKDVAKTTKQTGEKAQNLLKEGRELLSKAVEACAEVDGWASLGDIGTYLRRMNPGALFAVAT